MINRDDIYKIVKGYLPTADERLITTLTTQAEKQIELSGKDIIRKLVLRNVDQGMIIGTSRIDTKA